MTCASRPVVTFYNGGERVAHSTCPQAAARAAFRRLLKGDYKTATIYPDAKHTRPLAVLYVDRPSRKVGFVTVRIDNLKGFFA